MLEEYPAGLVGEGQLAIYADGVYSVQDVAIKAAVMTLLREEFRPTHRATATEAVQGLLASSSDGWLPGRLSEPLLNCRNGMADLRTGEWLDHDPGYKSRIQIPIEWDPDAKCPRFEAWAVDIVGDQLDDLEESASQMLDPSRTPHKALLLYGPARSGKSTYLRMLQAIAGTFNCSSVTLHQLASNRFMAARAYGKMLNAAADLSNVHIDDMSIFKTMTGEDAIEADPKYGRNFRFTNQVLFAFAANDLPTTGESSAAYSERVKPFKFGHSFAGEEDQSIEDAILGELPGILVRLVKAWEQMAARGHRYRPTREDVREEFERRSDRVRSWAMETCAVHPAHPGEVLPDGQTSGRRELYRRFVAHIEGSGEKPMSERKFLARVELIPGVYVLGARQTRTKP